MKTYPWLLLALAITTITACQQVKQKEEVDIKSVELNGVNNSVITVDSVAKASEPTNNNLPERKFIRTAQLKFKVKNVVQATYYIENLVKQQGGFVTYTHLLSDNKNTYASPINNDSVLQTTIYQVSNQITIRVPNSQLDSTLNEISKITTYLDYRTITADNVAFQLLRNNLIQKRSKQNEKKLDNIIKERNTVINIQNQGDEAYVNNLELKEKIDFSTIELNLYEPEAIQQNTIVNTDNLKNFKPSFFNRLLNSLQTGWYLVQEIVLFFSKLWALYVAIIIGFILYKKLKNK